MSIVRDTSFDIIVKSSGSLEFFEETNKISNFKNKLPVENIINGEWQVAAISYQYPRSWMNLPNDAKLFFIFRRKELSESAVLEKGNGGFVFEVVLPAGSYTTPKSVIDTIYDLSTDVGDAHQRTVLPPGEIDRPDVNRTFNSALDNIIFIKYDEKKGKFVWYMSPVTYGEKLYEQVDIYIPTTSYSKYERNPEFEADNPLFPMFVEKKVDKYMKGNKALGALLGLKITDQVMNGGMGNGYLQTVRAKSIYSPHVSQLKNTINTLWVQAPKLIGGRIVGNRYLPLLGTISTSVGKDGDYMKHENTNLIYLDVLPKRLEEIEIIVCDSQQKNIPFKDFQGDFVAHLNFRKKPIISNIPRILLDEIYIYLLSLDSVNDFPDNTPSLFNNKLPQPLNLDGEWEVALTEISYDKSWIQLHTSHRVRISYTSRKEFSGVMYVDFREGTSFNNVQEICDVWNNTKTVNVKKTWNPIIQNYSVELINVKVGEICKMIYLPATNKLAFVIVGSETFSPDNIYLHFSLNNVLTGIVEIENVEFASLLGIYNHDNPEKPEEHYLLETSKPLIMNAPPDLHKQAQNIWITSGDLIEPTQIASRYLSVLNTIPIKGKLGDVVHHTFKNRVYKKVVKTQVRNIGIKLSNIEQVPLDLIGRNSTVVQLHFRPVIKKDG